MKDTSNHQNDDKVIRRNSISKYGGTEGIDIVCNMNPLSKECYKIYFNTDPSGYD